MFHRRHIGPGAALVAVVGFLAGTAASVAEPPALPPATKKKVDFVTDIKPLLTTHCHKCHGPSKQEGGLRLDRRDEALNGGDSGPAFVSGKSAESLLIKYVAGVDPDVLMPPEGDKFSDEQIGLLRGWIDQGVDWPKDDKTAGDQRAAHWSFQPVRASKPPVSKVAIRHPVDAFVSDALVSRGLTPSPEADRATLIRRLSLDLLGLPPRPEETAEFLGDERPDACERLLDRLLASPHFGERWGRHWLDLARYADSDGYEKDLPRPHAWRWRDWVIEAFNRDLPFDQFTVEQLAGDLLPGATLDQRIATGFHRNTLTNKEGGADKKEDRDKQLVDRTNTTGAVWLGLTVGCAQCHSHKYDPISHREYYQLYAFFNAAIEQDIPVATAAQLEQHARLKAVHDVARQPLAEAVRQYLEAKPADALAALNPKDKEKLDPELQKREAALAKFDAAGPKPPADLAMILSESAKPSPTNIHVRGDFLRPGAEVQPAGLSVLNPLKVGGASSEGERPSAAGSRPNRLDLARWIVDESNPLTRRVAVNRIWQHLFGRGLVDPPDDFGTQGARSSHPELLDWLAAELPRRGWSRKELIRLIATSATYRQSSRTRAEFNTIDPKNVWLARQNRFRLEGEIVRDLALSVSGLLDDRVGGESIRPPLPSGVADLGYAGSVKWSESKGGDRYRRGCYIFFQRTVPYPLLMTFDSSDSNVSCARRERSNTPLQSLTLLNDPAFFECARAFGTRLDREVTGDPTTRSREAFRWTTGRELDLAELETLVRLYEETRRQLQRQPNDATAIVAGAITPSGSAVDLAASIAFSRILLNLDEFFTRE